MNNINLINNVSKFFLIFVLIFCMILNSTVCYAASAYALENGDYSITKCKGITEAKLRNELNDKIKNVFINETEFNFQKIVNQEWELLKFDSFLDNEIDKAVHQVQKSTKLIRKFTSSWFPGTAQELAKEVVTIAFTNPDSKKKINQLSNNMAEEISNKLQLISAKSSSYGIDCLQEFIGRQYSQTFVDIFAEEIKRKAPPPEEPGNNLNSDTKLFLELHRFAFKGIGVFLVTRVTKVIASNISNRVAKQLLDRFLVRFSSRGGFGFIPVAGEIIGGLLLVGDVFQSFDGALPAIQNELKKSNVKQEFKKQIVNTVEEELRAELPQISREISTLIYLEWKIFQSHYKDTLTLSEELPEFQEILTKTADKSKVYSLVGISLNNMGRNQLITSIKDGSFQRALLLPESSYKIIDLKHSIPVLVEWADLAGNQIENVVTMELYKHQSPKDLDRQLLTDILSIKDYSTIAKLSVLNVDQIRNLLTVAKQNLIDLSNKNLSQDDFGQLAIYLKKLEQSQANQLIIFLIEEPLIIKNTSVMNYIIQSRDIKAAIKFWKAETNLFSPINSIFKLYTGKISWGLFANKYGLFKGILLSILPILLSVIILVTWFIYQLSEISKKQKSSDINQRQESEGQASKSQELLEKNNNSDSL